MKKIIVFLLLITFNILEVKADYFYLDIPNFQTELNITASNYLLVNLDTKEDITEYQSNELIQIASLTKIMTTMVALESIDDLDKLVIVPQESLSNITGYTTSGFIPGSTVTYRDLLYGTMLPSGADAAQSLALLTHGSIDSFVVSMNDLAKKLNMNNTHFDNPIGKDSENNYSTLQDLKKLLIYALENKDFYTIYTTKYYETTNNLTFKSTLIEPSNKYNLESNLILGSKSGYTKGAGLCLSSIHEYNNHTYLLITTGSNYQDNFPHHILDSLTIYNYMDTNYDNVNLLNKGQEIVNLQIDNAFTKNYSVTSQEDVNVYLNLANIKDVKYSYDGINTLNYKIKKGTKLGTYTITYHDYILYSQDIYLEIPITYKYPFYFTILFILICLILLIILIPKLKTKKS